MFMNDELITSALLRLGDLYGSVGKLSTVIQAGSSLRSDASACLDIDLIALVDTEDPQGDISFFCGGHRVDVVLIAASAVMSTVSQQLRSNLRTLGSQLLEGSVVFGDPSMLAQLRYDISEAFAAAQPFCLTTHVSFMAQAQLSSLRKASQRIDVMSVAFAALGLLAKTEGPLTGGWAISEKQFLREAALRNLRDGEPSFIYAFNEAMEGRPTPVIEYIEWWCTFHNLPQYDTLRVLRPFNYGKPPGVAGAVAAKA
jgi:hypothetical protein